MVQLRLLVLALIVVAQNVAAQQLVLKTNDIQLLIEEWNIVHNARVIAGFENVYGSSVLYYGERLSRDSLISLKTKHFDINPDFRQRLTSDVTYTAYTSGVFKCDFNMEILHRGKWASRDAYLLVSLEDDQYRIVGESDHTFDKENGIVPELGEEVAASSILRKPRESETGDTLTTAKSDSNGNDDFFTMPKGFIFMLIAFIVAGGLLIFVTESIRIRRQRAFMTAHAEPITFDQPIRAESFAAAGVAREPMKTDELSSSEKQRVFESYVLTLFDPLFFKYQRSIVNGDTPANGSAITEFVFHNKTNEEIKFAVISLFLQGDDDAEWKLFDTETLEHNRTYSEDHAIDLYYIIGRGGAPDDPHELYLLPAHLVKYEFVTPGALQPFRKTGMFFYNSTTKKLQ